MAAAPAIAASLLPKAASSRLLTVRSSVGTVPPPPLPRFSRRRNYLRRKLLKTLTKPSSDTQTLSKTPAQEDEIGVQEFEIVAPPEPIAPDNENPSAARLGLDAVEEIGDSPSGAKAPHFVEVRVLEGSGVVEASPSGLRWVSARTAVKFGMFYVGVYVIQAIVRMLVVNSADSGDDKPKRRRSSMEEVGVNGREKLEMKNGELLYVNEAEMEAKVAEIRMLAMEAKERERKNSGDGNLGSDDEDDNDSDVEVDDVDDSPRAKSGIEREIDGRLTRVRRGLRTVKEKSPAMNVNFLNKPKQEDAEKGISNILGEKEEDKMLMFEKKYKFRNGDSSKPRDKPKGFQGSDRVGKNGRISGKAKGFSKKAVTVDMENKKTIEASNHIQASKKVIGDESLRMETNKDTAENLEQNKGNFQESENLNPQNKSREHAVPLYNARTKGRSVASTPSGNKGDSKKPDAGSNLWWMNLPCLFAIAMQQVDGGVRGFYSLSINSDNATQTQASYTVLFQDRGDAHNYCHLLESHFEDLEDISISVVPIPFKELNDAVKSQAKKVIVVRKGQLRLYAGQPLDEAETALSSLVD